MTHCQRTENAHKREVDRTKVESDLTAVRVARERQTEIVLWNKLEGPCVLRAVPTHARGQGRWEGHRRGEEREGRPGSWMRRMRRTAVSDGGCLSIVSRTCLSRALMRKSRPTIWTGPASAVLRDRHPSSARNAPPSIVSTPSLCLHRLGPSDVDKDGEDHIQHRRCTIAARLSGEGREGEGEGEGRRTSFELHGLVHQKPCRDRFQSVGRQLARGLFLVVVLLPSSLLLRRSVIGTRTKDAPQDTQSPFLSAPGAVRAPFQGRVGAAGTPRP